MILESFSKKKYWPLILSRRRLFLGLDWEGEGSGKKEIKYS